MNKYLISVILVLSICACEPNKPQNRILFITTNVGQMNAAPNGTYLIELAVPFGYFLEREFEIDIASPMGKQVPIYHIGDTTQEVKNIIAKQVFKQKTSESLSPEKIDPDDYVAVIIPGGYGQFWDVHHNEDILKIIASVYESGGVVGTIGHGTATLINVKLKSGQYLVHGKTMTCFPSWNEKNIMQQSKFGELLPFDMEEELRKNGANLKIYDPQTRTHHEIVDEEGRLVTAAFAGSGTFLASEVCKLISKGQKE